MKIFVSVEMEGVSGVTAPEDLLPWQSGYEAARALMTREANAAIAGAFDGGADEVLVNDSHDLMRNLLVEEIDRRVRVIRGYHKPQGMMAGLDASYGAVFLVGYHSRAGTHAGVLNHTFMGKEIHDVLLNGEPAGEARLNAALAGVFGVPVALVSGDRAVCEEAEGILGPVETVVVKDGVDKYTASLLHPDVARQHLREGAARALSRLDEFRPYVVEPPYVLGVTWNSTTIAATCSLIPGVRLVGARQNEFITDDFVQAMGLIYVMIYVATAVVEGKRPFE
jgi:D-amino peptidase